MASPPAAQAVEAAPAEPSTSRPRAALRGLALALPTLVAITALAAAYAVLFPGFLNYDSLY